MTETLRTGGDTKTAWCALCQRETAFWKSTGSCFEHSEWPRPTLMVKRVRRNLKAIKIAQAELEARTSLWVENRLSSDEVKAAQASRCAEELAWWEGIVQSKPINLTSVMRTRNGQPRAQATMAAQAAVVMVVAGRGAEAVEKALARADALSVAADTEYRAFVPSDVWHQAQEAEWIARQEQSQVAGRAADALLAAAGYAFTGK